ncbi:hypothetical protein LEL_06236 [Akanthomyces lecanii RCEF 1005]|uniref:Uncharacterized protein n=1 Tax=Akanthomyces lecanii RCEF 1005 TaxID=1081108 RepID=A0A162K1D7_CORDF|nr:hypothetical protein LEL_06236 [Akanthomyces lecanii RCEF 1005]
MGTIPHAAPDWLWAVMAIHLPVFTCAVDTLFQPPPEESREAAQSAQLHDLGRVVNATWLLYPLPYGLSGVDERVIGTTSMFVFVGVLDLVQVPLVSLLFAVLSRRWNYTKLHLNFSEHRFAHCEEGETFWPLARNLGKPGGRERGIKDHRL